MAQCWEASAVAHDAFLAVIPGCAGILAQLLCLLLIEPRYRVKTGGGNIYPDVLPCNLHGTTYSRLVWRAPYFSHTRLPFTFIWVLIVNEELFI